MKYISGNPSSETQDVRQIIEDEIAQKLNSASVESNEIFVFQDKQDKSKSSNVKLDDILTRKRDAADNTIALFQDGKLKPGVLASMVTDKLRTVDNTAASLKTQKPLPLSA